MNNIITAKSLVEKYKLMPHPEGGFFKENYRSFEVVPHAFLPRRFNGDRSYSTAIYFLLEHGSFSAFHKIQSDECWHFYAGGPLNIYVIHLNGRLEIIKMGNSFQDGDHFQAVVPAECWFASEPAAGSAFSFVGCTVAPGFDFNDFVLAEEEVLSKQFPQHAALIKRLCRQ